MSHGAENIIAAAIDNGVQKVVACPPTRRPARSTSMGPPSCCRTSCFVAANNIAGEQATRFAVVRYGNVAGSRGSVVPFFSKLIAEGARELPITDERMTRFWITLDHGVQFVLDSFARMHGGEVFVPKIPSIRIVDLASGMAAHLPHKAVGIRPGEKLHELMVPLDDARMTLEFADHYTIQPSIRFTSVDVDLPWTFGRAWHCGERGLRIPFRYQP